MPDLEKNRLMTIARQLTESDVAALEQGKEVYLGGYGVVFPQDLAKLDMACPGWRRSKIPKEVINGTQEQSTQPNFSMEDEQDKLQAEIIPFPLWQEDQRGSPRCVLRSALFSVIEKGKRQALEQVEIPAPPGSRIFFTGIQLDQFDLDVYLHCLHLAKPDLTKAFRISEKAFLTAIGRSCGKSDRMRLRKSLDRLNAAAVKIEVDLVDKVIRYSGTLIQEYYQREGTQGAVNLVKINPKLAALFDHGLWIALDWETRKALTGHPLAQWLHAFYSTHDAPYPYKVGKIKELCGSQVKHLYEFRRDLKKAIRSVSSITGWQMWIDEHDCLRVEKPKDPGG